MIITTERAIHLLSICNYATWEAAGFDPARTLRFSWDNEVADPTTIAHVKPSCTCIHGPDCAPGYYQDSASHCRRCNPGA